MEGSSAAHVELKGGGKSAIALGVVVEADFGDAPDSYGAAGSLFERTWNGGELKDPESNVFGSFALATPGLPNTRLGAGIDADEEHDASPGADADEFDDAGTFDAPIEAAPVGTYTLENIQCTGPGFVAGWIDWNRNGTSDEGERAPEVECTGGTVDLQWTVPDDAQAGATYVRLRIAEEAAQIALPTGMSTAGEVEDYAVDVKLPNLELTKTSDAMASTRPGDTVIYTITATNTGDADYTDEVPVVIFDDMSSMLDDSDYQNDVTAQIDGADARPVSYAEPLLSWTGPLAAGKAVTFTYTAVVKTGGDGDGLNIAWRPNDPTVETPPLCEANSGVDAETGELCAATDLLLPKLTIMKFADPADTVPDLHADVHEREPGGLHG